MRTTDPKFWEELTRGESDEKLLDISENLQEDLKFDTGLEDKDADDTDVSMLTLITVLTKEDIPETVGFQESESLTSLTDAENANLDDKMLPQTEPNVSNPQKGKAIMANSQEEGREKRQKFASKRYNGEAFW